MSQDGHRVHFSYWLHGGVWHYRFIDTGLAVLGPVRRTRDPETIRGIAERGNGITDLEAKLMLDYGLDHGQGDLYLWLTDEQYAALKSKAPA